MSLIEKVFSQARIAYSGSVASFSSNTTVNVL